MKLYGTTTSPFVRRVRVVAAEVGEPVELINTAVDDGQAALRRISPIWKVPVAEVGDRVLFDSRTIVTWLQTERGHGTLAPPKDPWRAHNLLHAVDAALESAIQVFYLRRDGLAVDGLAFAQRQFDRVAAIFEWLVAALDGDHFPDGGSLPALSLACTLDWMDFREAYPTAKHPGLAPLRATWAARPSMIATRPHA